MTDKVLQWHPGFCAALQIELQIRESGVLPGVRIEQEADAYRHIDCKEDE
ncbi:MAG: hypothetical protein ACLTM8_10850 [Veillonella parvula]